MADDSTTESEYFDEDDDCDERGGDPLGGVSAQSTSAAAVPPSLPPPPEPAIKSEVTPPAPAPASRGRAVRAPAVKSELLPPPPPLLPPTPSVSQALRVPSAPEVKVKTQLHAPPTPSQVPASGAGYAAVKANLPLRAGGLKAPATSLRPPYTYGYQPPPPVDYAPPLYQSLATSEAARRTAASTPARPAAAPAVGSKTVAATAPPRSSSSSQQGGVACSVCHAVLTEIPDLKIGWDCRCCGILYPTQQFPKQDGQHLGALRRCQACFNVWLSRQRAAGAAQEHRTSVSYASNTTKLPSLKVSSNPFPTAPPAAPRPAFTRVAAPAPAPAPAPTPTPAPAPASASVSPPIPRRSTSPTVAAAPAPSPKPAAAAAAPVSAASPCKICKRARFRVVAVPSKKEILACKCCQMQLPRLLCFSKSQRKEGKQKCKACLGHATVGADGFAVVAPVPHPPAQTQSRGLVVQTRRMAQQLNSVVVTAEREVAKYHNARRALQRKRESNDLRGSTRVEYEKLLDKEEAALKELEKKLRAKHPALFDKDTGIKVIRPSLLPDERERTPRPTRKAAAKAVKGIRAEMMGLKPKKVAAKKKTLSVEAIAAVVAKKKAESAASIAAAAVMRSLDRGPESAVTISGSMTERKQPASTVIAGKRRGIAAVPSAPVKPTRLKLAAKRKAPAPASAGSSSVIVIEDDEKAPAKKRKTVKADEVDPWLTAQQDIAQGLAELLGGSMDSSLSSSGVGKQPEAASAEVTSKAKAKVKPAPVDPSTYMPKTKLQAETPPRPTIVTRARRRTSQPVEVIEIN